MNLVDLQMGMEYIEVVTQAVAVLIPLVAVRLMFNNEVLVEGEEA